MYYGWFMSDWAKSENFAWCSSNARVTRRGYELSSLPTYRRSFATENTNLRKMVSKPGSDSSVGRASKIKSEGRRFKSSSERNFRISLSHS